MKQNVYVVTATKQDEHIVVGVFSSEGFAEEVVCDLDAEYPEWDHQIIYDVVDNREWNA